jgi:hypothetical protein
MLFSAVFSELLVVSNLLSPHVNRIVEDALATMVSNLGERFVDDW